MAGYISHNLLPAWDLAICAGTFVGIFDQLVRHSADVSPESSGSLNIGLDLLSCIYMLPYTMPMSFLIDSPARTT
jgi:hypothetical protein